MKKYEKIIYLTILVFMCIVSLACTRQIKLEEEFKSDESANYYPEFENQIEEATKTDWQLINLANYLFEIPKDWQVEEVQIAGKAETVLQIKNTDKKIVLGGAVPDDYYDQEQMLNQDIYADEYTLILMAIYPQFANYSWNEFLYETYGQTVSEFRSFQVPYRAELEAIEATEINGLYLGQQRFFVKTNKAIYDVALHYENQDKLGVVQKFHHFLDNFPF